MEKLKERKMRRKLQQMSEERTIEVLNRGTSGVLALLGDEGYPYALPISYAYSEGRIYFHSAVSGHKIDAVQGYDKASFCVIDHDDVKPADFTTWYRSAIAFGKVRLADTDEERMHALRLLADKYSPGDTAGFQREIDHSFTHTAIIVLDIDLLTGKESRHLMPNRH